MPTNLDLFSDDPVVDSPNSSVNPETPRDALSSPMVPSTACESTGVEGQWRYRGILLACSPGRSGYVDYWQTVVPLGNAIAKSDRRVQLCKAIDLYLKRVEQRR